MTNIRLRVSTTQTKGKQSLLFVLSYSSYKMYMWNDSYIMSMVCLVIMSINRLMSVIMYNESYVIKR